MQKVSAILPAYNEEKRIIDTITAIKELNLIQQVIVVDDGSTDDTYNIAKGLGIEAYKNPRNLGKGEALNLGIKKANGDVIILLDADLGKSASEAGKLILPIINNEADVTIAKFPPAKKKGGFGFVKKLASNGVYSFTGKTVTAVLSGQRAFKKEVINRLYPLGSGYGVEVDMTIDILNAGYSIKEVEVNMTHAVTGRDIQGFIHRGKQFRDTLKVLVHRKFSNKK